MFLVDFVSFSWKRTALLSPLVDGLVFLKSIARIAMRSEIPDKIWYSVIQPYLVIRYGTSRLRQMTPAGAPALIIPVLADRHLLKKRGTVT